MQKVWDALVRIERDESLASWEVAGIALWPILRMRIFRELTEQLGIFEKRTDDSETAKPLKPKKVEFGEYMVVPFVRHAPDGTEPYSWRIFGALQEKATPFDIKRASVAEAYFRSRYRSRALLAIAPRLRKKHAEKWARVVAFLEVELGANLGRYRAFPRWALVQFYAERHGWAKAFKRTKKLFMVNAWKRSMIAGAQAAGVWVVEPQHGLLTNSHPLLSWPGEQSVPYLPNELYLWGDVWANESIPPSVRKTVVGYDRVLPAYAKTLNTILFVGQVHHTARLLEIARKIAELKPEFSVVYKPHPQEDESLFNQGRLPNNLKIAQKDRPAIELIANSEYVFGVYSMALIEAIAIGAKVISLELPGSETLEAFAGKLTFAGANIELDALLASAKPAADVSVIFAEPLSDAEFARIVEAF